MPLPHLKRPNLCKPVYNAISAIELPSNHGPYRDGFTVGLASTDQGAWPTGSAYPSWDESIRERDRVVSKEYDYLATFPYHHQEAQAYCNEILKHGCDKDVATFEQGIYDAYYLKAHALQLAFRDQLCPSRRRRIPGQREHGYTDFNYRLIDEFGILPATPENWARRGTMAECVYYLYTHAHDLLEGLQPIASALAEQTITPNQALLMLTQNLGAEYAQTEYFAMASLFVFQRAEFMALEGKGRPLPVENYPNVWLPDPPSVVRKLGECVENGYKRGIFAPDAPDNPMLGAGIWEALRDISHVHPDTNTLRLYENLYPSPRCDKPR